jgi:hypothetical protein
MELQEIALKPQPVSRVRIGPCMRKRQPKSKPTWADVKARLASFDRAALLAVLQDLYSATARAIERFSCPVRVGRGPLLPCKKMIDRWLWPDIFRRQETSVSRAKAAIREYKKAIGDPEGLAELMVFYCERAAGFCRDVGHTDPAYFDALVRIFGQALDATTILVPNVQSQFLGRLDQLRSIDRQLGYGVGDDMDVLLAELGSSLELEVPHGERNRRRKN